MNANHLDRLSLSGLSVDCIVGVYPSERDQPQSLGVEIDLFLDTRLAAHDAKLHDTVDYARLWGEVRFLLQASRFLLLESAAEAITRYILAPSTRDVPHQKIQAATVRLAKPRALAGAGMPTLEIHRQAADYTYTVETKPFGQVDVIFATRGCGIYREHVNAGCSVPTHIHKQMDESELVLGSGLLVQGKPAITGTARHWPRGFAHRWDNPTKQVQTFLCVDRPAFIKSDEVEIDIPISELRDVEATSYFRTLVHP
ncbi:MAG: dihydroneopterin aldolase [Deltaproteobacteria bacterium]|nr:dihydroneopterin aldolase [Deltaproteobacteria bacterium]